MVEMLCTILGAATSPISLAASWKQLSDTDIAYRITVIESNLQASQVLKTCDYSRFTQNLTS